MAGWDCPDAETIQWVGTINATRIIQAPLGVFLNSVGIGTASPAVKFQVQTSNSTPPSLNASTMVNIHSSTNTFQSITGGNTGTVALFFGDTDAEIRGRVSYNNSLDEMSIWGAGAVAVTIDNNINVGINTTSPTSRLDVSGAITSSLTSLNLPYIIFRTNGTPVFNMYDNGSTIILNSPVRASLAVSGANFGIGSIIPSSKLEVSGGAICIRDVRSLQAPPSAIASGGYLFTSGAELYWRGSATITRLAVA